MVQIFLSASIPLPEQDRRLFETADVLAIREAIKALVEVVLPAGGITCGGHPAITPLLSFFCREFELGRSRITVFQSRFFENAFPPSVSDFSDVRLTEAIAGDRDSSLTRMRREMISSRRFDAAVVVGGMDGIFEEVALFKEFHPRKPIFPIASTGAAAEIVFKEGNYTPDLAHELTYPSLFRRKLLHLGS